MRPALVPILLADPMPWALKAPYAWDFLNDRARFAGGYRGGLANTPNWTFTRASTGYAQTSGGVLVPFASGELRRTDKGVLIEGAGTNLCLQSQDMATTWTLANIDAFDSGSIVNAVAAPDGSTTADFIRSSTLSAQHRLDQSITIVSATTYTVSVYAKAAGYNHLWLRLTDGVGTPCSAYFNLSTGALGTVATGTARITAVANGWYRCEVTGTSAGTSGTIRINSIETDGVTNFAGNGTGGTYLWGAQLEATAYASSYIPTTTASATRAADSLTVTGVTGLAYPLTIYCECELSSDAAGNQPAIWIDNGSGNTDLANLAAQMSTKKLRSTITASSAAQADISSTASSLAVGSVFKGALRVATNDAQQGLNGALATADTSVTLPSSPTILRFGINNTPGYLYGYLRRLAIFSRALSDGELQALTAA